MHTLVSVQWHHRCSEQNPFFKFYSTILLNEELTINQKMLEYSNDFRDNNNIFLLLNRNRTFVTLHYFSSFFRQISFEDISAWNFSFLINNMESEDFVDCHKCSINIKKYSKTLFYIKANMPTCGTSLGDC